MRLFRFLPILVVSVFMLPEVFARGSLDDRLILASPDAIQADETLKSHLNSVASNVINQHCAGCHEADLTGKPGVANLVDFDWMWGVTGFEMTQAEAVFEIMQTVLYGVRNENCPDDIKRYGGCPDTRFSQMPGYGELGFTPDQLNGLVDYVYSLAGMEHDEAAIEKVSGLTSLCAECHGDDGRGYKPFGGPDLTDDIWLYGSSRDVVYDVITSGRVGSCPAWSSTLTPVQVKAISLYIYNQYMGY